MDLTLCAVPKPFTGESAEIQRRTPWPAVARLTPGLESSCRSRGCTTAPGWSSASSRVPGEADSARGRARYPPRYAHLPGHRRCRLPRLAPLRLPAGARPSRDLRGQPRDGLAAATSSTSRDGATSRSGCSTSPTHYEIDEPVDFVFHMASPRQPDRLRAAAAAHAEGRRLRHPQLARPGQGQARALPAGLDVRGLRRPAGAPPARELLGQRQPDRPARRLRRGQALRRGADDGLPAPAGRGHRASRGSSTPTARGCAPTTAAPSPRS